RNLIHDSEAYAPSRSAMIKPPGRPFGGRTVSRRRGTVTAVEESPVFSFRRHRRQLRRFPGRFPGGSPCRPAGRRDPMTQIPNEGQPSSMARRRRGSYSTVTRRGGSRNRIDADRRRLASGRRPESGESRGR
ncbi:unnamed protein product, partial [Nesidiocoris tenuis]